jgi:hypothetical protein
MSSGVLPEEDDQRTQLAAIQGNGDDVFYPIQWIEGWASQRGRN